MQHVLYSVLEKPGGPAAHAKKNFDMYVKSHDHSQKFLLRIQFSLNNLQLEQQPVTLRIHTRHEKGLNTSQAILLHHFYEKGELSLNKTFSKFLNTINCIFKLRMKLD